MKYALFQTWLLSFSTNFNESAPLKCHLKQAMFFSTQHREYLAEKRLNFRGVIFLVKCSQDNFSSLEIQVRKG